MRNKEKGKRGLINLLLSTALWRVGISDGLGRISKPSQMYWSPIKYLISKIIENQANTEWSAKKRLKRPKERLVAIISTCRDVLGQKRIERRSVNFRQ